MASIRTCLLGTQLLGNDYSIFGTDQTSSRASLSTRHGVGLKGKKKLIMVRKSIFEMGGLKVLKLLTKESAYKMKYTHRVWDSHASQFRTRPCELLNVLFKQDTQSGIKAFWEI